ncbi:hypothetical protein NLU13_4586 [Sarocladium strictum]|uniref:Uncharacterized protein n=1 Tax=Sarocladium strictum TaxID=5046 RepID=A0AA39GJH1_SARSR|nr:hypothetical protein NLU13_4586 [Sarocladium strictum]
MNIALELEERRHETSAFSSSLQTTRDVQRKAPLQNAYKDDGASASAASPATVQGTSTSDRGRSPVDGRDYEIPDGWENLNEVASVSPVDETRPPGRDLESLHPQHDDLQGSDHRGTDDEENDAKHRASKLATQLYTLSYLIFFSLFGTLARVGLTALTSYPGTPIIFETIWANTGGSFIMGFLMEDRKVFRHEWGSPKSLEPPDASNLVAAKKAHLAVKKTIPLYIGMATGFCGSMTSFSTFIRDAFLALSNDMPVPGASDLPKSRNGGDSFMALLAVIITTLALSLSGLIAGAHFAIAIDPFMPSLPFRPTRKIVDPIFVVLGWGSWFGAVLLCIWPPHDYWRQRTTFSLVFAPLGTLLRFYLAIYLNGKRPAFPWGTFAANIFGTVVLGMAYDLAHAEIGGIIGCQVLQGVEDGFCGCLTTISTFVAELSTLRRKHAYVYGAWSVVVALCLMIAVMGGLRWTHGFDALLCT